MTAPSTTTTTSASTADDAGFTQATAGFRRELLAHCYRMTGSPSEAEDLVQETYLRAWRSYGSFEERSSLRTWLHRIATNVCLTALEGQKRRPLPTGLGAPSTTASQPLEERAEVPWLGPLPDAMLGPRDPGEAVVEQDAVRLAFVAALQHLPARQRAVLVLRDVLRWSAAEVAEALETTVPAVNSALQRAHASLAQAAPDRERTSVGDLDAQQRATLEAYVDAFWRKDVASIARLLTEDAVWEMPPFTGWYQGPETIAALIDRQCPGGANDMPMLPTTCNGQPAFGLYLREGGQQQDEERFLPFQLQVLELRGARVAHVVVFFDADSFSRAGLPQELSGDEVRALTGG
jgi:RNA polymerase sigma-70 factor (ECF subfamily)